MTLRKILTIATISAISATPSFAKGHLPPNAMPPEYADFVTAIAGARGAESDKGASSAAKELKGLGNSKDDVVPGDSDE